MALPKKNRKTAYRILMVTPEAVPFAKSGGLADVVSALAQELDRAGHDVRLLMPRYYAVRRDRLYRHPAPFEITVGSRVYSTGLYEGRLPESEVVVYFLDYEEFYGREGIYGSGHTAFADNLERFALLSYAAPRLGPRLGWEPQVVQSHDWPSAMTPMLWKRHCPEDASPAAQVLTIHNIGHQGTFAVQQLPETGLRWSSLADSGLLHHDELNLLRAGITHADMVTTVSPTYAAEIKTPTYGFSLDEVLTAESGKLTGILNGVDYTLWNPERDHYLEVNYTAETVSLKQRSKTALREELGLPAADVPLVGMVTRLVQQKGLEELAAPGYGALPSILGELPLQMVILGTGDPRYEYYLQQLSHRFANLKVVIGFSDRLAHLIEAASDFFLMPSRYEPCGLNQLYSLRYGTIPVVTRTGGLADTVKELSPEGGTGIFIEHSCPFAITEAMRKAVSLWSRERNRFTAVQRAAMKERFTWEAAARAWVNVYARAIKRLASSGSG